jgi:OmpA-OmpF porin, OOP family
MKTHVLVPIAAALVAALSSTPTRAQGIYVELDAGRSRVHADCAGTTSCDRDGTFVRAALGYQLTPHWAVEIALADLGRIEAAAEVPVVGTVQTSARLRSAGLGVAATLPLSDTFSLTGRVGVASNKVTVSGSGAGASLRDSERHTTAMAGVALHYAWSKTTSLGLGVHRTEAEYGGTKNAVVAAGVGVRVGF